MNIRTIFLGIIFSALAVSGAQAFPQSPRESETLNSEDRERYITEIRQYKHDFLARELDMSRDQQRDFFPVYDEMEDEVMRLNTEARDMERKIEADDSASDLEVEAVAAALYSQKQKEGEIEMKYYDKFKDILSPRQLIRLKNAERKFTQSLVRHHRRFARGRAAAENPENMRRRPQ